MLGLRLCCTSYSDEPHESDCEQSRRAILESIIEDRYEPTKSEIKWMAHRLLELLPDDILNGG